MKINVTHLRSFYHVARLSSFTAAARELQVPQPVLTQQVRRLEEGYGIELLSRSTRSVALTHEGIKLFELCTPVFDNLQMVEDFLKRKVSRQIVIHAVNHSSVVDVTRLLGQSFPDSEVILDFATSTEVATSIENRDCDFGILTLPGEKPEFSSYRIATSRLVAIVPKEHRWFGKGPISVAELQDQKLIAGSSSGMSRKKLDAALEKYGITPRSIFAVNSYEITAELSRGGFGIGLVGHVGFVDERLGFIEFQEPETEIDVHLACRSDRLKDGYYMTLFRVLRAHLEV